MVRIICERMNVDSFLFCRRTCPHERWIWSPYLYAAWEVRLINLQGFPGHYRFLTVEITGISHTTYRVANGCGSIPEMFSAPSTEMAPVRMDTEPVLVEVRI